MMDRLTKEAFLTAFAERARHGSADGPAWLRLLRRGAIDRFAERGLPTPSDEDWKYTSMTPLGETPFDLVADGTADAPAEDVIAPFSVGPTSGNRLVFVNGRYVEKLSAIRPLPGGTRLGSLAEALITDEETVHSHLAAGEKPLDAFTALNAAFWPDGAFLHVPAGVRLEEPIQLLFVATASGTPRVHHPRSLIVLERESRVALVESYVGLGGEAYLTNAAAELFLGPAAALDHHKITLEGGQGFHVGRTHVREARDSRFASCSLLFGGRLVRSEVGALLGAEGAECMLSGLFVIGGRQHVDIHTIVDHAQPRATSRQLYKGVLDGQSFGVFHGRIIVRPDAQKTDAKQSNKNLLLSEDAVINTKPQLEIYADDVKCTHGATVGQVDAEAVFYLRSRGIGLDEARSMLTLAFANEILDRIQEKTLAGPLRAAVTARLNGFRR